MTAPVDIRADSPLNSSSEHNSPVSAVTHKKADWEISCGATESAEDEVAALASVMLEAARPSFCCRSGQRFDVSVIKKLASNGRPKAVMAKRSISHVAASVKVSACQ